MNRLRHTAIGLFAMLSTAIAPATELATTTPTPGQWRAQSQAFGRVSAVADSRITLPFGLRVSESLVTPGQTVAKGAVMLRFDAPRLRQTLSAYRDARHQVALSQQRLAVLRSSRQDHTLTRKDLLAGEQALATAQAVGTAAWNTLQSELAVLDTGLDRSTVDALLEQGKMDPLQRRMAALHAPFAGVVATRPPTVGAWVEPGELLLELEDLSRVYVQVGVAADRITDWRDDTDTNIYREATAAHQPLATTSAGGRALLPLPGAAGIDPETGLRLLRFVADNADGRLRDGQWLRVLHRSAPRTVLWLPEASVVSRNGKAWCLIVSGDQQADIEPVEVTVGPAEQGRVPVLSGLQPAQTVLVEGAYEWLYRDLKDLIRFVD